jgi:hypothetical protein
LRQGSTMNPCCASAPPPASSSATTIPMLERRPTALGTIAQTAPVSSGPRKGAGPRASHRAQATGADAHARLSGALPTTRPQPRAPPA